MVGASASRSIGRGFDARLRRYQATTLGKLFTPTCLDADSLRYYMVSLKPGTFTFTFFTLDCSTWNIVFLRGSPQHEIPCVEFAANL